MLVLQFHVGSDRYALGVTDVVEVLPLVHIRRIGHAQPGVAGVFNYRGMPVHAIDLREISEGAPAKRHMNTRLLIVRLSRDGSALAGLVAERVSAVRMTTAGANGGGSLPAPGSITAEADGLLHWLDLTALPGVTSRVPAPTAGG